MKNGLLTDDDPSPVEWVNPHATGPVALVCEHAGRAVPARLGDLGVAETDLRRHIAWDLGAERVARTLARLLDAPLVMQRYSRLVIDCNRPPESPLAMPATSDGTHVPGNRDMTSDERAQRIDEIFRPWDDAVTALLDGVPRRFAFSIHSFTPMLMDGILRPWDIGFLFRRDRETSTALADVHATRSPLSRDRHERALPDRRRLRLVRAAPRRAARPRPRADRDPERSPVGRRRVRPVGGAAGDGDTMPARPHGLTRSAPPSPRSVLMTLSRDVPLDPAQSALLFIDVQNFSAHRDGGDFKDLSDDEFEQRYGAFFAELKTRVIPNMQRLQRGCREAGIEVMYTTIESLTLDGRDRSLDYKITGFNVPKGSWDAKVIDELVPGEDEIVLPKSSSSVFISTNIDYVLRNLGVRQLVISGLLTDQCVESAIRDACDLGYLVTQVTDACATYTPERQAASVSAIKGYCRQVKTDELVCEIGRDGGLGP